MYKKKHKSIFFLGLVFVLLTCVIVFQISQANIRAFEKQQELKVLQEEYERELERNQELEDEKLFIETDEFIMQKAREEFHLIQEGEIIFIQEDE